MASDLRESGTWRAYRSSEEVLSQRRLFLDGKPVLPLGAPSLLRTNFDVSQVVRSRVSASACLQPQTPPELPKPLSASTRSAFCAADLLYHVH